MKIYTSYFYKIRFFKPNMIPISTALWDPKWFHQGQPQTHWFIDKNSVINGLRADVFAPGAACENLCRGACNPKHPEDCEFLKVYAEQLSKLDINEILQRTETICEKVRSVTNYQGEPIAVFIVHEAATNPCSERVAIQNYFKSQKVECKELII